ncbi:IclR family transcriptional regulator [Actinocrispum wychmicini]|uniref:IclR family transcriptional regulator n=1 Tax=Actinocrispum wychmicini TaxID=1213861 RepID=A0A4R2JC18_9PSEU|nr:IclR family transcriptional regulator [Actinocrispum wychmicini]TCO54326.1 IclR family transcriptional regulator [Actinocrispum wychmicini]
MGRAVPAVSRALDILELFLDATTLSTPQIVERLNLPRTTVHELVGTLAERGYLTPAGGQPAHYRLGLRLFQLGSGFAENIDLVREAQDVATEVASACDEAVHVAILDGTDVVYIARVDSTHPVRMVSAVGRRLPAHCTGLGKMLLSGLSPESFDARYPAGQRLPAMTPRSITSVTRLRLLVTAIAATGVAYDDAESNDDVYCVAAPVYDHSGTMVAAMSISVPGARWSPQRRDEWTELVRRGSAGLSERLGYQAH